MCAPLAQVLDYASKTLFARKKKAPKKCAHSRIAGAFIADFAAGVPLRPGVINRGESPAVPSGRRATTLAAKASYLINRTLLSQSRKIQEKHDFFGVDPGCPSSRPW